MTAIIPTDLASALATRYELRGVLGRGGMATVYLAHDRKHQREVALKVLRPEIFESLGTDRFLAEIQIVARMVHPYILALHDSGESEGFVYYVMPYIEGGSLRQRLEAEGALSVERALAIAAPVADALGYAHRLGVFHRDIKPENILFAQTHPIVGDFGIAKALHSATGPGLTRTGISIGTPGYMSPEQAAGFSDIDARTDVYSLAVVIYEMVIGEIPGRWPTEDAVHAGRFLEAPPAHRARLSQLGASVEGALVRGLSIRPDHRTSTPAVLLDELHGVAVPTPRRRYRPEEIDEIVKRASELEVTAPTSGSMTIGGVEAIADEVGIPREHVRSAAAALSPGRSGTPAPIEPPVYNRFYGGPTRLLYERIVEGELAEADFPMVVEEIRRGMENLGHVSQLGKSFTWTMARGPAQRRDVEVAVTVRGGRTRITLHENLERLVSSMYLGLGGGLGGGGVAPLLALGVEGFHLGPLGLALLVPAWLLMVLSAARASYHRSSTKRQRRFERLADRLETLVTELVDGAPRLSDGY